MITVLTLAFAFETSAALVYAFGMTVTGTITITTLLFFYIVWRHWSTPLWLAAVGGAVLLLTDLLFLAANLTKPMHRAWLPLLITELHEQQPPLHRVSGTAVFLKHEKQTAPWRCAPSVEHYRLLHEHVVIISIDKQRVPRVPPTDRLVIDDLGYTDDGITHVSARFGYMDAPNAPEVLRLLETADIECPIEVDYGLVLRLHDRAASWHRQDHGPMAQAPVPRHLRHHRRRRRVLQPAP